MKNKNLKSIKKDIFNLLLLAVIFFIVYFIITKSTYLFGSTKDWNQQHWLIPEYFRNLFYENLDLFPDFAFNLGSGQNIYNFAYYGFLSPVIFVSYLLPFISMKTYIIVSTIFLLLFSVVLMYFFVKKKTNSKIAFFSSCIFLLASPMIFHAHRHIMFINYMPFLIMGYYGVDGYFESKNKWLLSGSVFLMIMTSYFFSVSGIISIILYGIYVYIKNNNSIKIKSFIIDGLKFLFPIIIAVLMSGILIVPTFYSLLNGRLDSNMINLVGLFIPSINLKDLLYDTYSLGLPSIALFSLIDNLFDKKENRFLSICLIIMLTFPICLYLLNGLLYVDGKVLITFLPLCILLISNTFNNILKKKDNYKIIMFLTIFVLSFSLFYSSFNLWGTLLLELTLSLVVIFLSHKYTNLNYFYFLIPVLLTICICFNLSDKLVERNVDNDYKDLIYEILDRDKSYYRIGFYDNDINSINLVYDLNHFQSSVYSSSSNKYFKDFYYNKIGNEVIFRSYGQMPNTNNVFYNMYVGNKYIVSKKFDSSLYDEIIENVYMNEDVLSLGFSTNRLMSQKDYDNLKYPHNIYAYLNYIIVEDDVISDFKSEFESVELDYSVIFNNTKYEIKDNGVYLESDGKNKIELDIHNDFKDKVLLISFDMEYQEKCSVGDTYIVINGVKNKLTCAGWKYQNKNESFEYVLSDVELSRLDISFSKGKYLLSNLRFFVIDNDKILKDFDKLVVDMDKTKGDKIVGNIDVSNSGYFSLSIPYDRGFNVYVDGIKIAYEKTDFNFIGFAIDKGEHQIMIEYKAPFKDIGILLSIVGFLLFFVEVFKSFVKEFKNPQTKLFKLVVGIYRKYKELVNYFIVGVLTTLVSLGSKWILLFTVLSADNAFELQLSIIFSWICAVLFAYFANRIFVFNSKNENIIKEMISFFGARILTLLMEMVIMWFFITLLGLNTNLWVIIWTFVTQALIMILNYIFSKLFVFKNK